MNTRLSRIAVCLLAALCLALAGCGDSKEDSSGSTSTQTESGTGATGATVGDGQVTDRVNAAAKTAYDKCTAAADKLQDSSNKRNAKQACKDAYDKVTGATKNVDQELSEAQRECQQEARKIDNEQARTRALDACDKIQ